MVLDGNKMRHVIVHTEKKIKSKRKAGGIVCYVEKKLYPPVSICLRTLDIIRECRNTLAVQTPNRAL